MPRLDSRHPYAKTPGKAISAFRPRKGQCFRRHLRGWGGGGMDGGMRTPRLPAPPVMSANAVWRERMRRPSLLSPPSPSDGEAASPWAAGVDEAGRGCLAGPVVAAAVILPESWDLPGLADSKKLDERRREALAPRIRECALAWGLGVVWQRRIDEINILRATFEAMARALRTLKVAPGMAFIDGNRVIPADVLRALWPEDRPAPIMEAVVSGDARMDAVAAASILAKTFRDGLMRRLARRRPGYGLERHKGYGTREHLAALRELGPCPLHRLTFAGVPPAGMRGDAS